MTGDTAAQSRAIAARAISAIVFRGVALDRALDEGLVRLPARDRSFAAELINGVLRWYWRLDEYSRRLLRKPFKGKDRDLHCLLLTGLYQIEFMRVPDYAGVSSTVEAAALIHRRWAAGVVNASLRRFAANRLEYSSDALSDAALYSHPQWMIELIRTEWPNDWKAILEANNAKAQTVLRVNRNVCSTDEYLRMLADSGIEACRDPVSPWGVRLSRREDIGNLPMFADGWSSVQDSASQLAVPLLEVGEGHRVLDACAAPGGKTVQVLEQHPQVREVVAVDSDESRCVQIEENLGRTGHSATLVCADAAQPHAWWDGVGFDRILIDAPCSGLGVIRRHPDIKHHRRAGDLEAMANRQSAILEALWPTLKPGGKLVYATCSISPLENQQVIERFRRSNAGDCIAEPLPESVGEAAGDGRQRIPGRHDSDGFFYARLARADAQDRH